jgi:hypothetical protein
MTWLHVSYVIRMSEPFVFTIRFLTFQSGCGGCRLRKLAETSITFGLTR